MPSARSLLPLSLLVAACGGTVVFEEDGGDGGGSGSGVAPTTGANGTGGASTSGSSGTGSSGTGSSGTGSSGTGSSGTGSSGTGSSGTSSGSVSASSVGSGGGGCSTISLYTDCLSAGECVPVFDDFCCSSCFPGECADCVDQRFVGCVDRLPPEPEGACGVAPCGFVPDWTCQGGVPDCSSCTEAGCVTKLQCNIDACEVWCDPVRPDACGPVACDMAPPDCAGDQVPEAGGGCWTGACIPAWVCLPAPPTF